jgi:hypothetical protein
MSDDSPFEKDYLYLAIPAVLGLASSYPNLTRWLDENLIPEKKTDFYKAKTRCFDANSLDYGLRRESLGSYFKRGLQSFLYDPVPQSVLNSSGIASGKGRPTIPWYLYGVS